MSVSYFVVIVFAFDIGLCYLIIVVVLLVVYLIDLLSFYIL